MKVFVYHTPEEIPTNRLPSCAVIIDVLRASSTITAAINAGAKTVRVFSEIEPLLEASEAIDEEQRIRAGERGGRKVKACEFGNSPLAFTPENTEGRQLFLSTTNGTRCSESVRNASKVIIASLTNRLMVVNYLATKRPRTVWLVGSGWEGSYSLEDTVCAGAIIDGLVAGINTPLSKLAGNDEAIAAASLFQQWQDQLPELLASASHGQRLLKMRSQADVEYCAQLDVVDTLPIQRGLGTFVQRQPGVVEQTCEFLGRLVGRKPVEAAAIGVPETKAGAPDPKVEEKKATPQMKTQPQGKEAPKDPKAEAKGKPTGAKAEAKPKAQGESKAKAAPQSTAPKVTAPKAATKPKPMEPKAKIEPKTTVAPKPTEPKAKTAPQADGVTKPASGSAPKTEPSASADKSAASGTKPTGIPTPEESSETAKSAVNKTNPQKSDKTEGNAPVASQPVVATQASSGNKEKESQGTIVDEAKNLLSKQDKGGAIVDEVKGLWAKMTQAKPDYQRIPDKKKD